MRLIFLLLLSSFSLLGQAQSAYHGGISDGYASQATLVKVEKNGTITSSTSQIPKAVFLSRNEELPVFVVEPLSLHSLQGSTLQIDIKTTSSYTKNLTSGIYFLEYKDEQGIINTLIIKIL